jgi:predicted PurR-regulated permease PerM
VSILVLLILFGVSFLFYGNLIEFNKELPRLLQRGRDITAEVRQYINEHLPRVAELIAGASQLEEQGVSRLQEAAAGVANVTAGLVLEALEIAFYLIFLLVEAGRFSERIHHSFAPDKAEHVLAVTQRINAAMASYLSVKVKASLILAVPIAIMLWVMGVKFAFLWGILFFFSNFIPYFGNIVMCVLAALFAFLQLDFGWRPIVVAVSLVGLRTLASDLIEPALTGKAVNLSPVVILISLSFWSLCWGIAGMLLAVPLTVMFKIVLENFELTRPLAKLMTEST